MIKIKYDLLVGYYEETALRLKNCEADIDLDIDENELNKLYQEDKKRLLQLVKESGMIECLEEFESESAAHGPLKKEFEKEHSHPYVEISNVRLINKPDALKANEVMEMLNITRPTLCHYVKRGLIKIDSNYTGKQYRYNKESVLALMDGNKKH